VGRRSIGERPEPAEKVELLFAEAGNIDEGIGIRWTPSAGQESG